MLYELDNFCALNSIRWDWANPREMFFSRCLFWFFFRQRKKEQEDWSLVIGYWSLVIGKEAEAKTKAEKRG